MKSAFMALPLVTNHRLFSIKQIDHTIPLKSISDLPDVTLSAVRPDGTVVHGQFKIIVHAPVGENFDTELVSTVIAADLKQQVAALGYHVPEEPIAGFVTGVESVPARHCRSQPLDIFHNQGSLAATPFLYGMEAMFRKVFNTIRLNGFANHDDGVEVMSVRLSTKGLILRGELKSEFSYVVETTDRLLRPYARNAVALAECTFNNITATGRLDHYAEFVNNYLPTFDESGSFQDEVLALALKAAPYLEGILTDLKFTPVSE